MECLIYWRLKVVQILFKEKLGELSGNAQRSLFQVIGRMIDMGKGRDEAPAEFELRLWLVLKTGDNISLMQRIVTQFHNSIQSAYPFYYYIGSAPLWQRHVQMLTRMQETIKQVQTNMIKTDEDNSKSTFACLPFEMQREVVRRLDNGTDIVNVGMINSNLYRVSQELLIWRQLCLYHFGGDTQNSTNSGLGEKILGLMRRQEEEEEEDLDTNRMDWKSAYFKLKRQYGLREVYAEMIYQCQLCKCLYWQVRVLCITVQHSFFFALGYWSFVPVRWLTTRLRADHTTKASDHANLIMQIKAISPCNNLSPYIYFLVGVFFFFASLTQHLVCVYV